MVATLTSRYANLKIVVTHSRELHSSGFEISREEKKMNFQYTF